MVAPGYPFTPGAAVVFREGTSVPGRAYSPFSPHPSLSLSVLPSGSIPLSQAPSQEATLRLSAEVRHPYYVSPSSPTAPGHLDLEDEEFPMEAATGAGGGEPGKGVCNTVWGGAGCMSSQAPYKTGSSSCR